MQRWLKGLKKGSFSGISMGKHSGWSTSLGHEEGGVKDDICGTFQLAIKKAKANICVVLLFPAL